MDHDDSVTQQPLMSNMSDETEAFPKPQSLSQESGIETEEQENSTQQQSLLSHTGDSTEAPPRPQNSSPESDAESTAEQGNANYTTVDKKRPADFWFTRLASTWWIESITICISFACMAALVCILALFQDRLSTDWSFFISLNATIAIAITAAKATLLATVSVCLSQEKWNRFRNKVHHLQDLAVIDTASRGPLGAIRMLFQVSWGFASISAVVVILSILTDTLVQQVVDLEPGTIYIYQKHSATFGYAYGFDGLELEEDENKIDENVASAILRGLYQKSWPAAFTCTSNCTWDGPYLTLGFSSTCANATEETIDTLECDNGEYWPGPCRMKTPKGGVQFNFGEQYAPMTLNSSEVMFEPFTNLELDDKSSLIRDTDLLAASVWTFTQPSFLGDNLVDFQKMLHRESVIVECTLGITLYNYTNVSSTSNVFNIGTTEQIPIGNYSGYTSKVGWASQDIFTRWWNDTGPGLPDVSLLSRYVDMIVMFMKSGEFSGTFYQYSFPIDSDDRPGAARAFGYGSLEEVSFIFDKIAMSLTDMVRQGISMQTAQGKTSQAVVFIRVRWRWLILPLAVHFLGAIALVGTIIGRSRDVPLWKGSALAVLYHSVDKDGILGTQVKNLEELDKVKSIQVMLEKKE
ncbi:hypothetical protein N5P37_007123 [Trichoderma harzianum]|uniref:Uncharacterized protein n=1 Tax=Trichoderma harzianum CBS 226.95 TaxID=983964 RepID=A0A2T4AK60_TRIHA|nr:hypothetical protein M431DRAFT_2570 [Trichoderma harzianum CBS 226.95]KAK0760044.1 hypothetical protein N5P37_007123 [Trichoderma harzianum]PTB57449.1 hypothetical protein M431DRAFT_2570 [Trichoderma harzianum CBS 226.95]